MTYKFFPHTEEDLKEMLAKAGVSSLEGLYDEVPESIRFKGEYDLPEAMSELEIRQFFKTLGDSNIITRLSRKKSMKFINGSLTVQKNRIIKQFLMNLILPLNILGKKYG